MQTSHFESVSRVAVQLPPVFAIQERWKDSTVHQVLKPGTTTQAHILDCPDSHGRWLALAPVDGDGELVLAVAGDLGFPNGYDAVLRVSRIRQVDRTAVRMDLSSCQWLRHPLSSAIPQPPIEYRSRIEEVLSSWSDAFTYVQEDQERQLAGLRAPQIGAVHAIQAHWIVSDEPATIVMPTGTGKTETMLCALIQARCPRLLVVVPTDALRTQIADKFLALGILKELGVVADSAQYPIVGVLRDRPQGVSEVDAFFEKCNVVVTTMAIAGYCAGEVQERMAAHCPYLFVDEAHHIAAHTWKDFRGKFESRRIIQFTATPFRLDDRPVDGRVIFNFPLRRAQEQGYFRRIRFTPVREYRRKHVDEAIAQKAIAQLREDSKHYNHVLMARAADVQRAQQIFGIYEQYAEFNPVQLHTGVKSKRAREQARRQIIDGTSRIVVCVDMLGEGFDLPELKIAAFHDIHKSLPVTLQLAGRFTRAKSGLGDPTFIANIADVDVRDELRRLYAHDSDWNLLLPQASEQAIKAQVDLLEFLKGFVDPPKDIPLQNLRPAMSAVIYRTKCTHWSPESYANGIAGIESLELIRHAINYQRNTLVIVTARKVPIDWGQIQEVFNWDWELYVVFWDETQQLLFINSSSNSGYYQKLAEAVAGEVELIRGQIAFRCLSGINRLRLQNVGLIRQHGRLIRYTMQAGSDVEPALTEAHKRNTRKGNIFGAGYEGGERTSIGCSYKGRLWSRQVTNVEGLTRWCSLVGQKVLDETIDPDEVLRGTLLQTVVAKRPIKMPIGIDWPEILYADPETAFEFAVDGQTLEMCDIELALKEPSMQGELKFELRSEIASVDFSLNLLGDEGSEGYRFSPVGKHHVVMQKGAKQMEVADFFYDNPPVIWFADGSSLEGNLLVELPARGQAYAAEKIRPWDWAETDIHRESQGTAKDSTSIQYRVIQELMLGVVNPFDWTLIRD